ncbi:MAG TPA: LysM peptidoglycan-binding domain-containing protein [Kiloniellaceae bacterium]|nr:LysM peptidoglycan-binding domain-containing protein [Kiloniellaceae bacterium]
MKRREQQAAVPATGAEEAAEGTAPTFDVVRVEPSGEAVIAGRAEPNSEVKVTLGDDGAVGTTKADSSGAWAIVAEQPLAPGSHEIGIEAKAPGGGKQLSEDLVVVMVPEPTPTPPAAGADGAAQAQAGGTTAPASGETPPVLAVLTPRGGGASKVLPQQPEEGIAVGGLVLDSVDYDETGRAILGGRAAPGARMLVYLDNKPIGEAIADAEGRWALSPASPILEGLHDLRVDQLADDGTVVARVETPFSREPARQIADGEDYVIVQPGNSLWRIARRTYGQGLRYSVIYQANADQIRDPDLIYPGQVFALPRVN